MNQQYITDWSGAMGDTFAPLGGGGDDDGLIELLWCNGHVVMQSQVALRKPPRPDKAAAAVQDDDAAAAAAAQAWFQFPVEEEDPLERDDLFSELFGEAQAAVDGAAARGTSCCKEDAAERGGDDAAARQSTGMMPPPPRPAHAHAPREAKACPVDDAGGRCGAPDGAAARTATAGGCEATATEAGESSMITVGSSFCGSNHVQTPPRARDAVTPPGAGKGVARAHGAATATSSATRSRSCTTKTEQPGPGGAAAAAHRSGKRKQSDATDAEDVEFESADVTCEPPAHKTTTAKRRRAAEVHNLSERRRRDRINEKMKALQELIPHCNKTDKASMLDEAIEYLKSLQLQLQMMWMGGGMSAAAAPMVFPAGVHQYMQRMLAAGPPPHVASMPGMPFMAAPPAVQGPTPLPVPDLYARYLAVDHHLPPPPLPLVAPPPYTVQQHCLPGTMGFYQRQNPALPLPPPPPPTAVPVASAPSDGILHKKYENCGKPEILQGMTG